MKHIEITTITVIVHTPGLADFLAEIDDVDAACEEYRAEYERRLTEAYQDAKCQVQLGETNGMGDYYYINDEQTTAGSGEFQDEIIYIEDCAIEMVNDWTWLTVA